MYGAAGNNTVNDDAFDAIMAEVHAKRRASAIGSALSGSTVVTLPPGDYRITELNGLLGKIDPGVPSSGLVLRGAGTRLTNVIFDPGAPSTLAFNNYWQGLRFEGILFKCEESAAGSTFMQSYTTNAAQDYTFTDCSWSGPWKYVFDLKGTNNNSEFRFIACSSVGIQGGGAFLYVGDTNTSDQFLNYWFFGHKHWSTDAPVIDMARGGNVHIFGIDISNWGAGLTSPGYMFNLREPNHARGVCNFSARGVRTEAKSDHAGLLFSEWGQGIVQFDAVDWSSHTGTFTYGDVVSIRYANLGGANYNFRSCSLAGGVKIKYGTNDYQSAHRVTFDNCRWRQRLTPSEVVRYDETGTSNIVRPIVEFIRCRGDENNVSALGAGASVWDASVGHMGETLYPLQKRSISVRTIGGPPIVTAAPLKVALPVGALITGLHAICPPGVGAEASDGTWTLATTEAAPTNIATVTPAVMNAGYDVTGTPIKPFLCDTRDKATVTVTPSNILAGQYQKSALLLIEGYW